MKILVLGSGISGLSTAYVLASRGHEIEIIDRHNESGAEASFANGGQLSYSHAEPWATPGVLMKLPKWLIDPSSPLVVRKLDSDMIRFGMSFLRNCTTTRAEKNCINILRLGLYSRDKMRVLVDELRIDFDYKEGGILHIFENEKEMAAALRQSEFQAKFGCEEHEVSVAKVLELEPALKDTERKIIGGIHAPVDCVADAHKYCVGLERVLREKFKVVFHKDASIQRIEFDGEAVTSVETSKGHFRADAYLMALGSYSPQLLKPLGLKLPIYPMKGYSVTVPASEFAVKMSVTDVARKVVFTRLGDTIRVAGTAEFAGYNDSVRESRIAPMIKAGRSLFPRENWDKRLHEWGCLRASTPAGPPILGDTPYRNLYLNTGHGTLGWTQAAGSAYIVADIIDKQSPEITLGGLTLRG